MPLSLLGGNRSLKQFSRIASANPLGQSAVKSIRAGTAKSKQFSSTLAASDDGGYFNVDDELMIEEEIPEGEEITLNKFTEVEIERT